MSLSRIGQSSPITHSALDDVEMDTDPSVLFQRGEDLERTEPERAVVWYKLAIEHGSMAAAVRLGRLCLEGKGIAKDEKEAVRLFQLASDNNDPEGMAELGKALFNGYGGTSRDEAKAMDLIHKAVQGGSAEAKMFRANQIMCPCFPSRPNPEIIALVQEAADSGNARGKEYLGDFYFHGWYGLPKDCDRGEQLYRESAGLGNADAMRDLGEILEQKDPAQARKWWTRAAEGNQSFAILYLGRKLLKGENGYPKDEVKAFRLWRKYADFDERSGEEVAKLLEDGVGCVRDRREAHRMLLRANRGCREGNNGAPPRG